MPLGKYIPALCLEGNRKHSSGYRNPMKSGRRMHGGRDGLTLRGQRDAQSPQAPLNKYGNRIKSPDKGQ